MRNRVEIESYILNIKDNIDKFTKDLAFAFMEGDDGEQEYCNAQIGLLQRQEEMFRWVLN